MADLNYLRQFYDGLSDDELARVWRRDLVPEAREVLRAEMKLRNLAMPALEAPRPEDKRARFSLTNPYLPPAAFLADMSGEAALSARGLVRLFQSMVIATTILGIVLYGSMYVVLPISQDMLSLRNASGFGALWPAANHAFDVAQLLFVAGGVGLYLFMWWGRLMFVAAYVIGLAANLLTGMAIWLPWEVVLITASTLLDGAILALAFLPPLARCFERTS
jgi:hypothetical protein